MALQGGFASEKNVAIAPQYQVILGKYNDFDNRFGVPEKEALLLELCQSLLPTGKSLQSGQEVPDRQAPGREEPDPAQDLPEVRHRLRGRQRGGCD